MDLLTIDYDVLLYVTIAAFALSGYMKGWWREGLTTLLLLLLVFFIKQPNALLIVVEYINSILEVTGLVVETGGDLTLQGIQTASSTAEAPTELDPTNRNFYIILLVVFILLAYFGSRRSLPSPGGTAGVEYYAPESGARILGAVVGAFNGFIVVNLFKEFIIGRLIPGTGIDVQAASPPTLSIAISQVPPGSAFADTSLVLIVGLGLIIVAFTLSNRIKLGGRSTITPPGYAAVKYEPPKK
ncbi:MAG: hypothetical protein AAF629_15970 [Chloroflexota bacterium]